MIRTSFSNLEKMYVSNALEYAGSTLNTLKNSNEVGVNKCRIIPSINQNLTQERPFPSAFPLD